MPAFHKSHRPRCAFDKLDHDQTGVLSVDNLKMVAGVDMTEEQLRATIAEIDSDGDGQIDFEEFRLAMRKSVAVYAGAGEMIAQIAQVN